MTTDLIIIGAGPAGMAAANSAAEHGLEAVLIDEQPRAGGQIYRDVDQASLERREILGADYTYGETLTAGLARNTITHLSETVVWSVETGDRITVSYTRNGQAAQIHAKSLLIATGALERPMPLPGWTLPGVMTVGAGQILLKQSGVVSERAALVGTGPLLYLLAAQMIRADTPPIALIETQTHADRRAAMPHIAGALRGWRYIKKGLSLLNEIRKAGVPRYTGAQGISIAGGTHAEAVEFQHNGQAQRIVCDTVYLHHGVVPNTQVARSINIPHRWSAQQHCFVPVRNEWGQSEQSNVYIAGDGAGIGGAIVAEIAGRLAALDIASTQGAISQGERDRLAAPLRKCIARENAIRPFLDRAYPPCAEAMTPRDDIIICRCEEVTAGDIRSYAKLGCIGPNQTKAFGRAGMGPCQGRYCGLSVTNLLSDIHKQSADKTGYYRIRPPLKPVTLGELAALERDKTED